MSSYYRYISFIGPCSSTECCYIIYIYTKTTTRSLWKVGVRWKFWFWYSSFNKLWVFRWWNFCPTIALHTFYPSLPLRTCAGPLWSPPLCSQWQIQMLCGRSFCHPIIIKLFLGLCLPHYRVLQRNNCFSCYVIHDQLTTVTR